MIGRKEEQRLLLDLAQSEEAEFAVVYGRRRVGKTYLVRETFENLFLFQYTGIANVTRKEQITQFVHALREQGWRSDENPETWFDAFNALRELVDAADSSSTQLIFLDEMPWMDNWKSDFLPAFEHFWNDWASARKNLTLIACGSATSWITKKVFKNKGGLYNRVTRQIRLKPFTLAECREYLTSRGIEVNEHDLIECYMVFGGIPFYLRMLERRYSLGINIDRLCFNEGAPLRFEYEQLMGTLFDNPGWHIQVIEVINSKKQGLTRHEIAASLSILDGGNLTRILAELEESGLIRHYKPYGKKKQGALYQLTDPFVSFHLSFIATVDDEHYWSTFTDDAHHRAWSGYAFEQVCLAHIEQIKKALGISGVHTEVSSWRSKPGADIGAQIDLVISRNDNVINLLEMKYLNAPLEVDKKLDRELRERVEIFRKETGTRKALHLTLVSTYGLKDNKYASVFQSSVTMDEFR